MERAGQDTNEIQEIQVVNQPQGHERPALSVDPEITSKSQVLDMFSQNFPPIGTALESREELLQNMRSDSDLCQENISFGDEGFSIVAVRGENTVRVFLGFRWSDDKPVALRMLDPQYVYNRVLQERFLREKHFFERRMRDPVKYWPEILGEKRIDHPESHYFGQNLETDATLVEFLAGKLLPSLMEQHVVSRTPEFIAAVALQISHALEFIHEDGYVLRDLKPDNVMIVRPERGKPFVRLFDGNTLWVPASTITPAGLVPGTPEYMSPELARGEALEGRSDLYALGCCMYVMMTGHPPFKGSSALDTMVRQINDPLPPFPNLEPVLEGFVKQLLAKEPADRPRDAIETSKFLARYFKTTYPRSPLAAFIGPALEV